MARDSADSSLVERSGKGPSQETVGDILTYFYPVHYRLGMEMEAAMSQGRVDRKQAAMLWLIHSRANGEGWVSRKEIEAELSAWFDISNSKISRMMSALGKDPLNLLELTESPDSGREKMLRLTMEGDGFVAGMVAAASALISEKVGHLDDAELRDGLGFLTKAFGGSTVEPRSETG